MAPPSYVRRRRILDYFSCATCEKEEEENLLGWTRVYVVIEWELEEPDLGQKKAAAASDIFMLPHIRCQQEKKC